MSRPVITIPALIGNVVVLIGLAIGSAFLLDHAWVWFGGTPFAVCATVGFVDLVFGKTVGLILVCLGLIVWVLSGLQNGAYLALAIGGLFIGTFPQIFAHYLGASCG